LPPMASALVWVGEMLDAYGLSLALGVCILLLLIVWGWRLPSTNLVLSRMLLRLGPVGRILSWWETVLFYRSLGLMLEFGVPMHEACRLAPTAVNNTGFQKALSRLSQTVAQGSSMVAALSECRVIPKVALRMVALGEQTGSLSGVLLKTADLLESRLNFVVGRILLITEPLITLFMGLLVGLVVITMLTTIFSLTQGGI
ncbi:MAG: type II secretion system F family protein, partial [Desulfarculaceae bacterium]